MPEEYEPPPGFERANFRSNDTAGVFSADTLGPALQSKDKALWMVKLPTGLDPKELEGMKLPLNVPAGPQAPTIARFTAGEDKVEYTVVPVPLHEGLAQPPPGAEMPSFDIFLPTQSKRGEMARVPRPSHYFTVALAPPEAAADPPTEAVLPVEISKEEARKVQSAVEARKTRRPQPEDRLRGYFSPAGATARSQNLEQAWGETQKVDLDDAAKEELRRLLSGRQQSDLRAQFVATVSSQPLNEAQVQNDADQAEEAGTGDVSMEDGAISHPAGGQFETNDPSVPEATAQEASIEEETATDADESKRKHRSSKDKEHKDKDKKRRSSSSKHSSKDQGDESKEHKHSSHDKDKPKKRRSSEGKDERKSKREKKE